VAAQLAASQEGHSSMKLVIPLNSCVVQFSDEYQGPE
jgi:hypothetical protein